MTHPQHNSQPSPVVLPVLDRVVLVMSPEATEPQAVIHDRNLVYTVAASGGLIDFAEAIMQGRSTLDAEVVAAAREQYPAAKALAEAVLDGLGGDLYAGDELDELREQVDRLQTILLLCGVVVLLKTAFLLVLLL